MNPIIIGFTFIAIVLGIYFYRKQNSKKETIKETPIFIEASAFSGAKQGYIYKMDSQGLGYYLDEPRI